MGIKPEDLAKSGTEHGMQMALFAWAATSGIPELKWLFAIPNGGFRDKITGGKLKAAGVKAGISDIMLPVPRRGEWCCGLFIELKTEDKRNRKNGGLSDEQLEFQQFVTGQGYRFIVAYSWTEARDGILQYLGKI